MRLQATSISTVLFAIAVVIALATAALIAFAFGRRRRRERHFRTLDEVRQRCLPIVHDILAGTIDYAAGIGGGASQTLPVRELAGAGANPAGQGLARHPSSAAAATV